MTGGVSFALLAVLANAADQAIFEINQIRIPATEVVGIQLLEKK